MNDFKKKFDEDKRFRSKITEQIMVYNDAFLDIEKSKILAKLFRAHIEGQFDWDHFKYLGVCLNSINPKAFGFLSKLADNDFNIPKDAEERKRLSLERDGEYEALLYSCGIGYTRSPFSSSFYVSQLGKDLFIHGIK